MFDWLVGNTVWQLVSQADALSKLVLFILLAMSIICWTLFLYKLFLMRKYQRDLKNALHHLQSARSIEDLNKLAAALTGTLPGHFIAQNILFLNTVSSSRGQRSAQDGAFVQENMNQIIDDVVVDQESYLTVLSTSAAVAPLLGLFGTVWGLIHSFIRISEKQSADITVVAPGLAEALIVTLVGLIVAIPALVMYNYLAARVRAIEGLVIRCADRVGFIMQQSIAR